MLLSSLINQPVHSGKHLRGFARGIGFSLKTGKIKYLFCSTRENDPKSDFALNATPFFQLSNKLHFSSLRPVLPKNCVQIFPYLPLYNIDGTYLGQLTDAVIENGILCYLISDANVRYSLHEISACADAILLRKKQAYPIGQRIPAPMLFDSVLQNTVVTKPLLKNAIKGGKLIRLTLSLPPFDVHFFPTTKSG